MTELNLIKFNDNIKKDRLGKTEAVVLRCSTK